MRPEISDGMVERIERLSDKHGYESVAEFVRDATRRRIEDIEGPVKPTQPPADLLSVAYVDDTDYMYATGEDGQLWEYDDKDNSWTAVSELPEDDSIIHVGDRPNDRNGQ